MKQFLVGCKTIHLLVKAFSNKSC